MVLTPVYMDNHSTTRVDPRVVEAMRQGAGALVIRTVQLLPGPHLGPVLRIVGSVPLDGVVRDRAVDAFVKNSAEERVLHALDVDLGHDRPQRLLEEVSP